MLDRLTVDDFRPALGQRFALDLDGHGSLDLELVDASAYGEDASAVDESGHRSPFRVEFRGPTEPVLPQRIYRLENEATGALEIFIVPVGATPDGTRYEAIFA